MNRPGDWNCRSCTHLNFQRRDSCQRCGEPRPGDRADLYGAFSGRGRAAVNAIGGSSSFAGGFGGSTGPDVRPGDWYCTVGNCGTHNFASRSSCFKCGAYKEEFAGGGLNDFSSMRGFGFGGGSGAGGSNRAGWKSGDWICTRLGCNEHNFASRMDCFQCSAPRDAGSKYSY